MAKLSLQIEFPSILLPPDIHSGSIVDINVARNQQAERLAEQKFSALQQDISQAFGSEEPCAPVLRRRNATQTSVVLEWDPIQLATAELRNLSLYRNGTKAGVIPRDKSSTKISGLALDTEYTFHLVLRTSAGQYSSERIVVKTHKMTDLSGITVTPGIMPNAIKESLAETIQRIGAKMIDTVRIDTTHFVCTEPRGQPWEKAVELNVPVVVPDWAKGCEREGKLVGVRGYYLDADPKLRQMGPSQVQQQAQHRSSVSSVQQQAGTPRIEHTPPTPERSRQPARQPHADGSFRSSAAGEVPTPLPTMEEDQTKPSGYSEVGGSRPVRGDESSDAEARASDTESVDTEKASGGTKTLRRQQSDSTEEGGFDEVAL